MRVLVTAGPTREHWDRVRFLSSGATGRLGILIAEALAREGHECDLVLGPTHLETTWSFATSRPQRMPESLFSCRARFLRLQIRPGSPPLGRGQAAPTGPCAA